MELCIFDGSKIFQKDEFLHGKMHIFLLFGWLQKMYISYFVDFIEIAACILQKGECFSAWLQKMYISYFVDFIEIAACILQKGENMHFPMEKCKFLENLGAIKNA